MASLPKIWSPNKKLAATTGANVVPNELKAWDKFNLDDADSSGPSTLMYGLAATCRMVMPPATTNKASKNKGYSGGGRWKKQQTPEPRCGQTDQNAALVSNPRNEVSARNGQQAVSRKPCKLDQTSLQKSQLKHLFEPRNQGIHKHRDEPPHEKERGDGHKGASAWISSRSIESWKKGVSVKKVCCNQRIRSTDPGIPQHWCQIQWP